MPKGCTREGARKRQREWPKERLKEWPKERPEPEESNGQKKALQTVAGNLSPFFLPSFFGLPLAVWASNGQSGAPRPFWQARLEAQQVFGGAPAHWPPLRAAF